MSFFALPSHPSLENIEIIANRNFIFIDQITANYLVNNCVECDDSYGNTHIIYNFEQCNDYLVLKLELSIKNKDKSIIWKKIPNVVCIFKVNVVTDYFNYNYCNRFILISDVNRGSIINYIMNNENKLKIIFYKDSYEDLFGGITIKEFIFTVKQSRFILEDDNTIDNEKIILTYVRKDYIDMPKFLGTDYNKLQMHEFHGVPDIKCVYFNNEYTTIVWYDETHTIVKCSETDTYDAEKAIAVAICKKLYGNGNKFSHIVKDIIEDKSNYVNKKR